MKVWRTSGRVIELVTLVFFSPRKMYAPRAVPLSPHPLLTSNTCEGLGSNR